MRKTLFLFVYALLYLTLARSAVMGQILDCPGIANYAGYKVVLDNISVFGSRTEMASRLLSRLEQKVQYDLATVRNETAVPLTVVPCLNRSPKSITDFSSTIIDSLNGHRVLVEIWGQVESRAGFSTQKAELQYALVPISFYDQSIVPPGGFSTAFQKRLSGSPDEVVKLFGEFSDLKAYVSVAAGVKSLKEHDYDQAYTCFCVASTLLRLPPSGLPAPVVASLMRYLDQKINDVYVQAHSDHSVRSALSLAGTRPVCPEAP